jgi:hypothetical protein
MYAMEHCSEKPQINVGKCTIPSQTDLAITQWPSHQQRHSDTKPLGDRIHKRDQDGW